MFLINNFPKFIDRPKNRTGRELILTKYIDAFLEVTFRTPSHVSSHLSLLFPQLRTDS